MNFMDSDDVLSDNVFESCILFFEKNYELIDIVSFPMIFFDGRKGEHWLNTKFKKGTRVISLRDEYTISTLTTSASFIKAEAMKNIKFDKRLLTCEDAKVVYTIMMEKESLGVVDNCVYWYRRRTNGMESAVQSSDLQKNYYIEYFDYFVDWIVKKSQEKYGYIPNYMQYLIGQQLQWRLSGDPDAKKALSVLSVDEFELYKSRIKEAYKLVPDEMILKQEKMYREHKNYLLQYKYNKLPDRIKFKNQMRLYYENTYVCDLSTCTTKINMIDVRDNILYIDGCFLILGIDEKTHIEIYVGLNGELQKCELNPRHKMDVFSLGEVIMPAIGFKNKIILNSDQENYEVQFWAKIENDIFQLRTIKFNNQTCVLSNIYKQSYYCNDGWIIKEKGNGILIENIIKTNDLMSYEENFLTEVKSKIGDSMIKKQAYNLREKFFALKLSGFGKMKKIWLISDRVNMAGDNGEAFFDYLLKIQPKNIDYYFVIGEGYPDADRLSSTGRVLYQGSEKHKIMHLFADVIISAHADEYIRNPFVYDKTTEIFRDLIMNKKFVFLQHGITKDDVSTWLNKYNQGINGLVTAAKPEYKAFLDNEYYYSQDEIWLTGFPRYDRLYHNEKKVITIMPTWRKSLNKANALGKGINGVCDDFINSEYFAFYNALINNEVLLSAAESMQYTIAFMPHPNIMGSLYLFHQAKNVKFYGFNDAYRDVFAESDLIVTDYSSSAMDFAYLRKPIIYCQFDADEFWKGNHSYEKGYFDYERDGFGEVEYNLDAVVNRIIEYMKHNCKMKELYKQRCDKFFAFNDKNNCERVFQRILSLDKDYKESSI